jgi:hypothetical protein
MNSAYQNNSITTSQLGKALLLAIPAAIAFWIVFFILVF